MKLQVFCRFLFSAAACQLILCILLHHISGVHSKSRDFYKILGVSRSATIDQIKKSYRSLTLKYHPDRNKEPSASERFTEVAAAYEVLSNPQKRSIYDRYGEEGLKEDSMADEGMDIFDLMGSFGGFGRQHHRRRNDAKSPPLKIKLYVDLSQLYFGDMLHVSFIRPITCLKADDCIVQQKDCSGPGVRTVTQRFGPGFLIQNQMPDESCIDHGQAFKPKCSACPNGKTEHHKSFTALYIDPGMTDQSTILFENGGVQQIGHLTGDVIFELHQLSHPSYSRKGADLTTTVYITLLQALLGFKKRFHHINKKVLLIERSQVTHDEEKQVFKGWGMPIRFDKDKHGDLIVTYRVQYPTSLTSESRKLILKALENVNEWKYEIPA